MILVIGGAAEELLPKVLGVGFPILMAAVQYRAVKRPIVELVAFAVAAGIMEDSLCSLPIGANISYFLIVALAVKFVDLPRFAAVLTYPIYQLWLVVWAPACQGNIYARLALSLPIGTITAFAVITALLLIERGARLNDKA